MRYVYRCPECGAEREVEHGMNERPGIWCENVEEHAKITRGGQEGEEEYLVDAHVFMHRVIQPAPFRTRGPGFESRGRP